MMQAGCKWQDYYDDAKKAVELARELLKTPEEQEARLGILNLHFDVTQIVGDNVVGLTALEECMEVYKPLSVEITK